MSQKLFTRVSRACVVCRSRKVKCDGFSPCGNCVDHRKHCHFPPPQPRRHKARENHTTRGQNENTAQPSSNSSVYLFENGLSTWQGGKGVASGVAPDLRQPQQQGLIDDWMCHSLSGDAAVSPMHPSVSQSQIVEVDMSFNLSGGLEPHSQPYSEKGNSGSLPTPESSVVDREEIVIPPEKVIWEHQGPSSWASICSGPGQRWVYDRTGAVEFPDIAQRLLHGWTRRLKVPRGVIRERCAELESERAWIYTDAYFEKSHDRTFGVVYRPDFESRLRQHFENNCPEDEDVAWYALRNAVYAEGCRSAASKNSGQDFARVQAEAAQYFENAALVLTELQFTPGGLMAVQAVVVMTTYAEGLGSSAVDYILCATAARLAQSKGLHRQPSKAWNLPVRDVLHRNWLFWAIYCYEKYISLRSGRPSCLDDDDISCEIPDMAVPGSTINVDVFTNVIKHAQICSQISKRLLSVRAFRQTPEEIVDTVRDLGQRLTKWWDSLPGHYTSPTALGAFERNQTMDHVLRFHHSYYGSRITLHANLAYPWISEIIGGNSSQAFREQVALSSEVVAEAARQIVKGTRRIDADVSSPSWLVWYFPMLGVINLFIYILKNPKFSSAECDLALLDIAAGHFGHVKLLTASDFEFTFPREISRLAHDLIKRCSGEGSRSNLEHTAAEKRIELVDNANVSPDLIISTESLDDIDFDLEAWKSLPADDLPDRLSLGGGDFVFG